MFYLGNIGNHVSSYDSEGHYINLIFYVRNKIYLLQVRTIFLLLFIYFLKYIFLTSVLFFTISCTFVLLRDLKLMYLYFMFFKKKSKFVFRLFTYVYIKICKIFLFYFFLLLDYVILYLF